MKWTFDICREFDCTEAYAAKHGAKCGGDFSKAPCLFLGEHKELNMSGPANCEECNDYPAPGETCRNCGRSTPPTIDQIYKAADSEKRGEIFLKVLADHDRMQNSLRNIRNWSVHLGSNSIYKAALEGLGEA